MNSFSEGKIRVHKKTKIFLLASVIILDIIIYSLILMDIRIDHPLEGVTEVEVTSKCDLDFYEKPAQPVFTVALACAGMDFLRIWPLPFVPNWEEFQVPEWSVNT